MKVTIFYDDNQSDRIKTISALIENHGCQVIAHYCSDICTNSKYKNPVTFLSDTTHILFILTKNPMEVHSFIFYSGYAVGKGIPILLLQNGDLNKNILSNFAHFLLVLSIDSFDSYFHKETQQYEKKIKKDKARTLLLEKGYPCFDANMVNAVISNDIEIVSIFLDAGFSPSTCDSTGTPVLSLSVRNSFLEMTKLLINAGADVNKVSEDRLYSALMDAAQIGDYDSIKILLENGANTNLQSKDGQTAIILSVGRQDVEITMMLLKYKADPNLKDMLNMSALKYAQLFNNKDILSAMEK